MKVHYKQIPRLPQADIHDSGKTDHVVQLYKGAHSSKAKVRKYISKNAMNFMSSNCHGQGKKWLDVDSKQGSVALNRASRVHSFTGMNYRNIDMTTLRCVRLPEWTKLP